MRNASVLAVLGVASCCLMVAELGAGNASTEAPTLQTVSNDVLQGLRAAVDANPESASTRARLGYLLQEAGRHDEAAIQLQEAHRLDPTLGFDPAPSTPGLQRGLGSTGPDVWVCDLPATQHWSTSGAVNGFRAYSIATTSANGGDEILTWDPDTIEHPAISQNMYRYSNGRLTQIGMSWLKHGFCALQNSGCGNCQGGGFGCPTLLNPGCSDPYDASLNGTQFRLGPHAEVNATSGVFTLPHAVPNGTGTLDGRLQVLEADLTTPGALYLIEGQYIHVQDATAGNEDNNASWRPVTVNGSFSLSFAGATRQREQAIQAWAEFEAGVTIQDVDVPADGRFTIAHKASDNGDGTWRYEYAIHNMNSDKSGQAFGVPVPDGVTITNAGFHSPPYHSGDGMGGVNFSGTPWATSMVSGNFVWSTNTEATDPNANALRWGTMYNFWFDADTAPTTANATLQLFKGGGFVNASVAAPEAGVVSCAADFDGDGNVGASDFAALLGSWGGSGIPQDLDGDGNVGSGDLALLLGSWGPCV